MSWYGWKDRFSTFAIEGGKLEIYLQIFLLRFIVFFAKFRNEDAPWNSCAHNGL